MDSPESQYDSGRTRRLRPRSSRKEGEKGGAKRPRVYSKASPRLAQGVGERGRKTTAGVLEGFAPCSLKGEKENSTPAPVPLFVHFVDFCEFGVGDGGGTIYIPTSIIFFIFRVSV